MLDLDHFKPVNDTYGHDVGDEVLRVAAARIRCHVRDTDTVARLGGDEFVVVQHPVRQTANIQNRTERIISALKEPIMTRSGLIQIGASAGVAIASRANLTPEALLAHADRELYRAKNAGRGTYSISSTEPASPCINPRAISQNKSGT